MCCFNKDIRSRKSRGEPVAGTVTVLVPFTTVGRVDQVDQFGLVRLVDDSRLNVEAVAGHRRTS